MKGDFRDLRDGKKGRGGSSWGATRQEKKTTSWKLMEVAKSTLDLCHARRAESPLSCDSFPGYQMDKYENLRHKKQKY